MLFYYVFSQLFIIIELRIRFTVIPFLFMYCYFAGVIGTFTYHKIKREYPELV